MAEKSHCVGNLVSAPTNQNAHFYAYFLTAQAGLCLFEFETPFLKSALKITNYRRLFMSLISTH